MDQDIQGMASQRRAMDGSRVLSDPVAFIHDLTWRQAPTSARKALQRCLLDLAGVAAAGTTTPNSRIVAAAANAIGQPGPHALGARLLFDGRRLSPPAAAMANAATIDSFDAHDGHRETKGHVGVVTLPAALAVSEELAPCDGDEFLARLLLGYELGTRAGIALHRTATDYHTSGAWNALAAAAIGARALGLDTATTRHALGTAEYFGPRSPMMRVVEHPSMLKDGATMGGFVGVLAALLARDGYTGAPAVTIEDGSVADLFTDLGQRWIVEEQYLKPYPVCRWAQPAVTAVAALADKAPAARIERIRIESFHEAVCLAVRRPADTEQAQYALPFPVAARLVRGALGADEVAGSGLSDPAILALADRIELVTDEALSKRFPMERIARVTVTLEDGTVLESGDTAAPGDPEDPLSDTEVSAKFDQLATPILGVEHTFDLKQTLSALDGGDTQAVKHASASLTTRAKPRDT